MAFLTQGYHINSEEYSGPVWTSFLNYGNFNGFTSFFRLDIFGQHSLSFIVLVNYSAEEVVYGFVMQ